MIKDFSDNGYVVMDSKTFTTSNIQKFIQEKFHQHDGTFDFHNPDLFHWQYVFNNTTKQSTRSKRIMSEIDDPNIDDMITKDLDHIWNLLMKSGKKSSRPVHSHTNILLREKGCDDQLYHIDHFDGYIAIWCLYPYIDVSTQGYDINVIKVCITILFVINLI